MATKLSRKGTLNLERIYLLSCHQGAWNSQASHRASMRGSKRWIPKLTAGDSSTITEFTITAKFCAKAAEIFQLGHDRLTFLRSVEPCLPAWLKICRLSDDFTCSLKLHHAAPLSPQQSGPSLNVLVLFPPISVHEFNVRGGE